MIEANSSTDGATDADPANGGGTDTDSSTDKQSDSAAEELSETQVFDILQNSRRRSMLRFLEEEDGEAEFGDIVNFVASRENDVSGDELTDEQRRRVYVSLSQTHIPKLEAVGIVVYHNERELVERLSLARQVERYMEDKTDESTPWSLFYFALALTAFAAVAARSLYLSDGMIFYALALTTTILLVTLSILHFASINGLLSS